MVNDRVLSLYTQPYTHATEQLVIHAIYNIGQMISSEPCTRYDVPTVYYYSAVLVSKQYTVEHFEHN